MRIIKEYILVYRKWIGIVAGILLIGCILLFPFFPKSKASSGESVTEEIEQPVLSETPIKEESHILVDVKGAVVSPGVYSLKEDARVNDAILQAGGGLENADLSCINLSKKLMDEMVIIVYTKEQVEACESSNQTEYIYIESECDCIDTINDACMNENSTSQTDKISLNHATQTELETLPGIGASKAQLIIEYRAKTPFQSIEELKQIKGIGDSIFEKVQAYITV